MMSNIADIDQVTEAVFVLGASLMGFAKYMAIIFKRERLRQFIADMQYITNLEKTVEQMEYHRSAERKSQFINRIYLRLLAFSASILIATPAIVLLYKYLGGTLSVDRLPLTFSYIHHLGMDTTKIAGYLTIYAAIIAFLISLPMIVMTIDLLFLNSCLHIIGTCLDLKNVLGTIDAAPVRYVTFRVYS